MPNQNKQLDRYHKIAEMRYSIKEALHCVPVKDFEKVRSDIMDLLGIRSRQQLNMYINGQSVPKLNKAKAVEAYFNDFYSVTTVWNEMSAIKVT